MVVVVVVVGGGGGWRGYCTIDCVSCTEYALLLEPFPKLEVWDSEGEGDGEGEYLHVFFVCCKLQKKLSLSLNNTRQLTCRNQMILENIPRMLPKTLLVKKKLPVPMMKLGGNTL